MRAAGAGLALAALATTGLAVTGLAVTGLAVTGLAVTGLALTAGPAAAQQASLEGSWSGGGYAEVGNGQREKVRCRVRYSREAADVFGFSAVCASASVKLTQTGTVSRAGANRFVGEVYNAEFDISGRIRVVVSGSSQSVTISTGRGSGSLSLSRN